MSNYKKIYLFFLLLLCLDGCKKPLPDPHLNDYIYQNLKQELSSTESQLNEKRNQLKEFQGKVREADIQSSNLKVARAKADFAAQEVRKLEQKVIYWKMKLLSREEVVRTAYLASFNKEEEWNNSDEVERFKKSKERSKKRKPASASTPSKVEKPASSVETEHGSSPSETEGENSPPSEH